LYHFVFSSLVCCGVFSYFFAVQNHLQQSPDNNSITRVRFRLGPTALLCALFALSVRVFGCLNARAIIVLSCPTALFHFLKNGQNQKPQEEERAQGAMRKAWPSVVPSPFNSPLCRFSESPRKKPPSLPLPRMRPLMSISTKRSLSKLASPSLHCRERILPEQVLSAFRSRGTNF